MTHPVRLAGMVRTHFDYAIGPATAFIGPNGTGKSSALTGLALPFEGKRHGGGDVKDLTPPDADHAASAVVCDDGTTYSFDSRVDPFVAPPATAPVVIRPATRLVTYGKARVLEEVVSRWGGSEAASMLNPPDTLTEVQKKLWVDTIASIRQAIDEKKKKKPRKRTKSFDGADFDGDGLDDVLDVYSEDGDVPSDDPATLLSSIGTVMRSLKKKKGAEIKTLKSIVNPEPENGAIIGGAPVEDLPRLLIELTNAEAYERSESARRRLSALHEAAAAYQRNADSYTSLPTGPDRAPIAAQLDTANNHLALVEASVTFALNMCNAIGASMQACPCCGQAFDAVAVHGGHLENWKQWNVERTRLTEERDRLAAQLNTIDQHTATKNTMYDRLEAERQRIMRESSELNTLLANVPQAVSGTSYELRTRVDAAKAAQVIRNERQQYVERIARLEQENVNIKTIEQAAEIALKHLTSTIMGQINYELQSYLPIEYRDRFAFNINKGRFEMIGEDGRAHAWRDQSGAEFASIALALARSEARGRPAILLLEYGKDLSEFDDSKRVQILEYLATSARSGGLFMVAVASPIALQLSEKWTVINTSFAPGPAITYENTATQPTITAPTITAPFTAPTITAPVLAPLTLSPLPGISTLSPLQPILSSPSVVLSSPSVAPSQPVEVTAEQIRLHRWSFDDPNLPEAVKDWVLKSERTNVGDIAVAFHPARGWFGAIGEYVESIPVIAVASATVVQTIETEDDDLPFGEDEDEDEDEDEEPIPAPKKRRSPKTVSAHAKNGHAKKPSTRATLDASRKTPTKPKSKPRARR
jgi:hypothetical protein